jgi:adhesin transport system membrane fusion protein
MKQDIHFVNSLYGQANEKPPFKIDIILLTVSSFFILAITWAVFAEIDELARGEGKVIPAKKIQTIQNLDGGIISEILVNEGDHVVKNQPLMKIDTIRFAASLEENKESYFSLLAKKTRLDTELKYISGKSSKKLKFPKELTEADSDYMSIENKLFKHRINEYKNSIKTLEYQLYQKKQELKELYAKEKQLEESVRLLDEQLKTIERLTRSGSKSKIELLQIKSKYNDLSGELEATSLSIPRVKLSIAEADSKIKERKSNFKSEASLGLQETEAELKRIKARMVSDNDKLSKTIVRSPVNGIIKLVHLNTVGGVVKSGDNLIEIVPDSETLLIEAKIDPKDIAFINPTQKAIVKLTAYDFSIYGSLDGKIVEISADSIEDDNSKENKTYYKVTIKTDKNHLERDGEKLPIIPGMIASVDIITGKKTIMDFVLKPILKTQQNALHER